MAKNIVIFSDGTGQDGGKGPNTNVYNIFNSIVDRSRDQISFYDPGCGASWWRPLGKAFGLGISTNIKQCYKFLLDNFEAGDHIYLFGFSRGAATVRSLSGFIELVGILPKSRLSLIAEAFKIYETKDISIRKEKAETFLKKHHTHWTKVKFIGVFDTVAALVGPSDFHNFDLCKGVEHARHAISLDDRRVRFDPVKWTSNYDKATQTMKQVNFLGVHTDVGGGYDESGLSDISYEWMLKEAEEVGLKVYEKNRKNLNKNPNEKMNEEVYMINKFGFLKKKYKVKDRTWDKSKYGELVVHDSVFKRTKDQRNQGDKYHSWAFDVGCVSEDVAYEFTPTLKEA